MNTCLRHYLLLLGIFLLLSQGFQAQKCRLNAGPSSEPVLLKGKKAFNMNAFQVHLVMYVTQVEQEDSLCHLFTDSLRFLNDTILMRVCDLAEDNCSDTLVAKNELSVFINNSYWQKLPVSRLKMIKSKRQPLAPVSVAVVIVSYAAFVSSAVVSVFSQNPNVSHNAAVIAGITNSIFFLGWGTNVFVAKKRFKFNKFKTYNSYKVMM